jgi:hypothetical protein
MMVDIVDGDENEDFEPQPTLTLYVSKQGPANGYIDDSPVSSQKWSSERACKLWDVL